jgi:hypothetical protein
MKKGIISVEDYFIVFTLSTHKHWLIKRLRKPFQHVFAVKRSPGGRFWIIISPLISHTLVDMVSVKDYPSIYSLVPPEAIVVKYTTKIKDKERYTLCIINCVEIVKSLLGIRAFWVWTPYQLYKYIQGGTNGR